jgi:peptidoglycan/xylan/chitin deacetylase (PgdA/CDA1 family)
MSRSVLWLAICLVACRSAEVRSTRGASPAPAERLAAGFRYSVYGPDYNPGPSYWGDVGRQMSARFPGSVPGAVWIVGRLKGQGSELSFPGRSDDPRIQFTAEDQNEETLALFDRTGVETWLQVEPGHAPVEELIRLMLARYGHHPCVVGVGVDVEWYRSIDEPDGQAVSDAEAKAWLAAARAHNPRYRLFLKHWLIEKMPPTAREGLFFIDDSQILPSLDAMVTEFAEWGRTFAPAPVGFQIGYESDRPWWKQLKDPPAEIGRRIVDAVPNARALYWVDFTVLEVFPAPAPPPAPSGAAPIVGVKIYERPADLPELFGEWQALHINTAFTSEALAEDAEFRRLATERGIDVFVIAPVFYNPDALARDPDLYAITADGAQARDDWVQFVCPSRPEYRARRIREIAELVRRARPQGLSIDFIRHFVFWEKVHPSTRHADIPNACFCRHCVTAFAAKSRIRLPDPPGDVRATAQWILAEHEAEWTDWKVGLINSMTEEIVRAAREVDPSLKINLHAVPWRRNDFGGAILRNAGQDHAALSKLVDYLSPMCYAHMLENPPDWVHRVVVGLARDSAAPVLPSIQVGEAYRPGVVFTPAEFEEGLRAALKPPSRGVVFWSWDALVKEPEKLRIVREVLAPPAEHPSGGTAASEPPGALAIEHVPLFVQLGFDDNGISGRSGSGTSGGLTFVNDLFKGRRNPPGRGNPRTYDGSPALFSLYTTTRYIETGQTDVPQHVKRAWRAILEAGHEIGLHTHRHEHGKAFTSAEWSTEVGECVRWLEKPFDDERAADPAVGIGVSRAAIAGFRAPFLEYDRPLFPALRANGIAYDCSIEEGFEDRFDGRNFLWPYRIAAGYGGASDSSGEFWELPVYALIVPPDEECERYGVAPGLRQRLAQVRDYFKPADGKITGFDWNLWVAFAMSGREVVATFKYTLDQRLLGNRAPLTFGVHSDIYSEQYPAELPTTAEERRQALREILDYALARPEVRVVSGKQLLDWLRDPAPLAAILNDPARARSAGRP